MANEDRSDLTYEARRKRLADKLSLCDKVNRHDSESEREAWTLAHAFLDLEASFERFSRELLPLLERQDSSADVICDVLHSIGEEFRHILYHIGDPKFYRYLPPWGAAERTHE